MFTVVVTLFVVCWLPYHVYFVYQYIDHNVISYKHVQHIFLAFYWLAMSNTMINPLVYYFMNTRCLRHSTGYWLLCAVQMIKNFFSYFQVSAVLSGDHGPLCYVWTKVAAGQCVRHQQRRSHGIRKQHPIGASPIAFKS